MKITDLKTFPVWGGWKNYLIVKVETDEGIYGVGESGMPWRELAVLESVESLKPRLIGQDPTRKEYLWQVMFRSGFFPATGILSAAISAIDIALWDIHGKALGVPVYELLGGLCRDKVVCYPHCAGETTDVLAEDAQRKAADGWKFVRWHLNSEKDLLEPSQAVRRGIEQCRAIREAVGPDIELIVDIHTRLDPADSVTFCRAVEPYRPFFVEDPLRSENDASYHRLRQHVTVPLGVGEHYTSKWQFRELVEHDLIDYARIDVCLVGGLTEARKVAGWCETHYINLAPHNPLGPVSAATCLHLDLASPNLGVQEMPQRPGMMPDVFPVQIEWADGYLLPPSRAGLGVEFDERVAKKYPLQMSQGPMLRREDGAFTNW
ncbi:MAG: galactonate dehydratase [candidate division Zixibacteria bacterium]|nr:galactonate dehydratase [candidate division Zixibacteria bacterium]